jgi:hypothetical protein
MAERVESVMQFVAAHFEFPSEEAIGRGDIEAVAQLWNDRSLTLQICVSELICDDPDARAEIISTLNDMRRVALNSTPCLQALMRETAAGKITARHAEMIECAVGTYRQLRDLLDEACGYVSPQLLTIYRLRQN